MLIRVQEDAILPNEYRADIKECFVNVSGYGELSSERYVARVKTSVVKHAMEKQLKKISLLT